MATQPEAGALGMQGGNGERRGRDVEHGPEHVCIAYPSPTDLTGPGI